MYSINADDLEEINDFLAEHLISSLSIYVIYENT